MTTPTGRPPRRSGAICGGRSATGLALDDEGFDPSTLVYWRKRMAKSERPHRINDAVRRIVEETGVLAGRRRRAVDSTILADAVATQDTVTQLISAIRRVGRQVPGAAELIAAVCTGHDYTKPGKPGIDWDDPAAKDALVSALVNDANAVVAALAGCRDRGARSRRGGVAGAGRRAGRRTRRGLRRHATGGGGSPARSPRTG